MSNVISRTANNLWDWVNERAPGMMPVYRKHMSEYYAPKNFNFWYYMGSLALLVLVNQILTGIFLTMHYKPSAAEAFSRSEEHTYELQPLMRSSYALFCLKKQQSHKQI